GEVELVEELIGGMKEIIAFDDAVHGFLKACGALIPPRNLFYPLDRQLGSFASGGSMGRVRILLEGGWYGNPAAIGSVACHLLQWACAHGCVHGARRPSAYRSQLGSLDVKPRCPCCARRRPLLHAT